MFSFGIRAAMLFSKKAGIVGPYALFGGGTNRASKYGFTSNTSMLATALVNSKDECAATGNGTLGIFGAGSADHIGTATYTYATNAAAAGTNLTQGRRLLAAMGTSTMGLFGGGYNNATATHLKITDRYTYSSHSVAGGSSLTTNSTYISGCGNASAGIMGMSNNTSIQKYLYATNVTSSANTLSTGRRVGAAFSSTLVGFFAGGLLSSNSTATAIIDRYIFSNDTVSVGVSLVVPRYNTAAAGNSARAVIGGGNAEGGAATTNVYQFSNNTITTGASLAQGITQHGATSSAPGHY